MKVSKTKKTDKLSEPEKIKKSPKIKAAEVKDTKTKQKAKKESPQKKEGIKKVAVASAKKDSANKKTVKLSEEKKKKPLKKALIPKTTKSTKNKKTEKAAPARKVPAKSAKKTLTKGSAKAASPAKKSVKPRLKIFLPEPIPHENNGGIFTESLNEEFGENELIVMAVDPNTVFVDWEIRPEDIYGENGELFIRVYDVTGIHFDGLNANRSFDLKISKRVNREFIDLGMHGKEIIIDIGIIGADSKFKTIMRSDTVAFPELLICDELGITKELFAPKPPLGYV